MMASRIVIVLAFILGISVPIQSQTTTPVDFGFSQSSFSGSEQGENYKVQVKFFSGGITTGFFYNLSLDLSGTASSSDVRLSTTRGRFLPSEVNELKDVEFSLSVDNIAQESNETFAIVLHTNHFGAGATIRDRLEVVIIDSDVITFQLSESDYTQNEETNAKMEVLITKESGIQLANPVYFRITPLTVGDALARGVIGSEFEQENPNNSFSPNRANYKDFNDSVIYFEFPSDKISVEVAIPIVDDDIDEADEQLFIILLEVVNATNLDTLNILENRHFSIGRIRDDEIIRIGFERPSYNVTEPGPEDNNQISNLVYLIRENNQTTEQTYSVDLTVGDPGVNYKPATIETSNTNQSFDYSFGVRGQTKVNMLFEPKVDRIAFVFSLNTDLAVEGTETFRATSAQVTPSGNFSVFLTPTGVGAFATTLIHILDDDELKVGFEKPNYTVIESDGTVEVCAVITSPPKKADLDVILMLSASTTDGTAGAGSDFTGLLSTSLEFPTSPGSTTAGPHRECFDVTITDDNTPENTESFSLFLQEKSKTGAIISPNRTEIFILDKDEVVIGFLSESYTVSESDGTVSIEFGVITGNLGTDISVQLSFSDGSALSGSDYTSREGVYSLTGRETVTVDIGIIGDDKFEHAEVFYASLSFDVVPPPRVTLQPDQTQITIIDDDAIVFSFHASAYSFMENIGTGTVYVDKINGSTDLNITLMVSGILSGGKTLNQPVTFSPLDSEKAITFNIADDSIALEPPEKFTSTLTAVTSGDGIMLQPNNNTDITILDEDELIIGFAGDVSVFESENATLSITFSSAFATNFNINVGPPKNDSLSLHEIAEPVEDYFLPDFTVEAISILHNADNSLYFDETIIQDEFLEYEECFVTVISLPNSVTGSLMVEIAGGKDTALVCIENDDRVTISFDPVMYSVNENDGTVQINASLIQGELRRPVEVLFSTMSGTATSEDFRSLQGVTLQFDEVMLQNEVLVTIMNDNIFEDDEIFFASLITNDAFVNFGDNATITIVDDGDEARFGFGPVQYTVNEGAGSVALFVVLLEGTLERDVNLQFSTVAGTAKTSAPADYQTVTRTITFSSTVSNVSITVTIFDDSILESTENFLVNLSDPQSQSGVSIMPSTAKVNIIDNDGVTIGFEHATYSVDEGDVVEVCAVLTGALEKSVEVSVSSSSGSATVNDDYNPVLEALTFDQDTNRACFNVTTVGDQILEETTENLNLDLSTLARDVTLLPNQTKVTIRDDDRVTFGLNDTSLTLNEEGGATARVCVIVTAGTLGRDVIVTLNTMDGTATSIAPADFAVPPNSITFKPGDNKICQNISILDDTLYEEDESFSALLSTGDSSADIDSSQQSTTINIKDTDEITIGFTRERDMVEEDVDNIIIICVEVKNNGTLEKSITVQLDTVDGTATANEDYNSTSHSLVFTPDNERDQQCRAVNILSDDNLEGTETFMATLFTRDDRVSLNPDTETIFIVDNDVVNIVFIGDPFEGREDSGFVAITVGVMDPEKLKTEVSVNLTTESISNAATTGVDYRPLDVTLTFSETVTEITVNISLLDDNILEGDEDFKARLSTISGSNVGLGMDAIITIVDDDRVTFGLKDTSLTLNEEGGATARVCVIVTTGTLGRDVIVTLNTMDGTATSVEPADFVALLKNFTFKPGDREICQNISILDDTLYEEDESFSALLNTGDSSADIDPSQQSTTINIKDTDEITIGFTRESDMVEEDVDTTITICVEIKNNGTLEKSITVQLDTVDGTAKAKEDYNSTSYSLVFTPDNERAQQCRAVNILSDDNLEGTETFMAALSTGDDRVSLNPDKETIFIVDNDVVNIVFIGDPFEGREDSGFVVITVGVMEPDKLKTEVSVNLTTEDIVGISNAATAGVDYTPPDATLTFSETVTEITVNIKLIDDNALEGDEDFKARLSTSSGSNVGLPNPDAIITIVDADRAIIGFEEETVQVDESIRMKTLCVNVSRGQLERTTVVSVSSQDQTAINGRDYSFQPMTFTFSKDNTRQCFDVGILDDDINEPEKTFLAMLTTGDPQVTLSPDTATITIIDNDVRKVDVNDTIIGDPLFTVPILVDKDQREMLNMTKPQLCYEIHGDANQWFNLVTDNCTTVNALYTSLNDRLNVITKIGVKAVDDDNKCVEILVNRSQCSVSVDGMVLGMKSYLSGSISVRRYSKRARISVPNCNDINLIMWVICEERTILSSNVTEEMLKFVVLRGLNYGRRAHGLLGQFWNVPFDITPYTDLLHDNTTATDRFNINVKRIGNSSPRSFTGWLYDLSWDHVEEPCLYVGNKQAGPIHEVITPNDGVIESIFQDYKVASAFSEENYVFGLFNCPDVGSGLGPMQP